jgi:hypothetical protein
LEIIEMPEHSLLQLGIFVGAVALGVLRRDGKFAHQRDELFLDEQQFRLHERQLGVRTRQAERGVQFVDRAVSFDTQVVLVHAAAVHQAGRAVVPGACGDRHALGVA